ncbi:MAG TPA: Yip1 family protein [Usitatibacter sp.]|nr:Yip1 family protein [Usitatibacter sp.]
MNIVQRVKNIILTPKTEWDVIATEPTAPKQLVTGYVIPLAAIGAIAIFLASAMFGMFLFGLVMGVWHLVVIVASVLVSAFVIDALAPTFAGQKNFAQALKVAAYSFTPSLVGAVLLIIPILGGLLLLLISLYCLYVMFLGLPRLMKNPEDKTIVYEIVVILVAVVVSWILFAIGATLAGGALMGGAMIRGAGAPSVSYERSESVRKLDDFAKKMEEAGKKMEAAEKSGDQGKQMEAAMSTLATAMSGGKGVEPVQIDALKPFVPDTFAGLPRTDLRTERGGMGGFMTANAEGVYGDATGKTVRLHVTDTGGVAGLMTAAAWMNVQGEKENADRRETTRRDGNRLVHEEVDKRGGNNTYTVVVADRFVVEAKGAADIATLKSGVNALNLSKLESLK